MSDKKVEVPTNHLGSHPFYYCCGMIELGNFNYIDPPDGKRMTHYHNISGSWRSQSNQKANTREQIKAAMGGYGGGIMASTGAGQEWVEPILAELGWKHVFTFVNPGHAQTPVKVWCYSKNAVEGAGASSSKAD